ncbi:hypothetical protein Q3G72_030633 [Acer saccharum]|nr:hypothetical protein Q3G72_030633 [Acer saccharum]
MWVVMFIVLRMLMSWSISNPITNLQFVAKFPLQPGGKELRYFAAGQAPVLDQALSCIPPKYVKLAMKGTEKKIVLKLKLHV